MKVYALGLSHRTAPLDIREGVAFTKDELPQVLHDLRDTSEDMVILSTCNRTEFYSTAINGKALQEGLAAFLDKKIPGVNGNLSKYLYSYEQEDAVRHLFRVASGLDSMILGEDQILGQVREGYATAISNGSARGLISKVFHHALRVGKKARRETRIGENALSISSAAVETAKRTLGDISQRRVMVIGAGEAGKLVARAMKDRGVAQVLVINRTLKRAQELAQELGGEAASFDNLETLLGTVDIVVSSTGSQEILLTQELVARAASKRNGSPLLVVDIAIPRDADPAIGKIPGVSLLDMDDLESVSRANHQAREMEASKVEDIIDDEVARFSEWWTSLKVAPSIAQLKAQAELLRQGELLKTLKKMPHLSEEDTARIEILSRALVKKLLHNPIASIKENPAYMETAQHLFGLDVKEQ